MTNDEKAGDGMDAAVSLRPANPPRTSLTQAARIAEATLTQDSGALVTGIALNASQIEPGDIFAALPGRSAHGAQFAVQARDRGAVAILTDATGQSLLRDEGVDLPVLQHGDPRSVLGALSSYLYGNPSQDLTVIAITGTSGKTTTSYLIERVLLAAGRNAALIGTVETRLAGQAIPSSLTTPEAPTLHALFALMRERGIDTVVMEVSSHALALGRVDGVEFDIAAFTNLSQDHLDFHPTLEHYFQTKGRLFDAKSPNRAKASVVCVDDEWGVRMASKAGYCGYVTTVSVDGDADWIATDVTAIGTGEQTANILTGDDQEVVLHLPLPGRYNIANALVALAVLDQAGIDVHTSLEALSGAAVPGRLEKVNTGDVLTVVDYAHKPAALEAVLDTLRGQTVGRLAVVVGAGGDRDRGKRPMMGAVAAQRADYVVITDDNPRSEDPAAIRAEILVGIPETAPARVVEIGDREKAITAALLWATPGDTVLIAGKGHEAGQEIAGRKYPFDDRVVAARVWRELDGPKGGTQ